MLSGNVLIVGQGLAGSCLAWVLHLSGHGVILVDRGEPITASRIAAGLITPVTGRRLTIAHRFAENHRRAVDFYRQIERELGMTLLWEKPAIRDFLDVEERSIFERKLSAIDGRLTPRTDSAGRLSGFEMRDAARLHVSSFLDQTRQYFASRGQYWQVDLNLETDIVLEDDGVFVNSLNIRCSAVALCQGYERRTNRFFPSIPDNPAKGEILRVRLDHYRSESVVHKGIWLVPDTNTDGQTSFLLGATFDRSSLDQHPTAVGRDELLTGLQQITLEPAEVIDHVAAVRAGMHRRRPIVGRHPDHERVFLLNGLGSHGALLAPVAAQTLRDIICEFPISDSVKEVIDILPAVKHTKSATNHVKRSRSLTQLAHNVVRRIVRPGDTVVDATAGNGNDTQMLATLVGSEGRTIAIDIQPTAIAATSLRLQKSGLHAELFCADHAPELERLKSSGIRATAVMFNLGYLPGSNHLIVTEGLSTLAAIRSASELLAPGGVITIIAYRGHPGGEAEAVLVEQWIAQMPEECFETSQIEGDSNNITSPVLFLIRKRISTKSTTNNCFAMRAERTNLTPTGSRVC
ncbi:MAG: FAD-dependent oxidoreductase [Planctomycetaceae bacterium]